MGFNFLEYFFSDKYDDEIIIRNFHHSYCVSEIKEIVLKNTIALKNIENQNISINTKDNFDFIIILLASIFANKNIVIQNFNNKNEKIENVFSISKLFDKKLPTNAEFLAIDTKKVEFTLYTSGTTSKAKKITKDLNCIIKESNDLIEILNFKNKKYEFIASVPINHLYAITAYIFTPLNSKNIINTDTINYLEDIKVKNSILISSPSFLSYIEKYNLKPLVLPDTILSAGANLRKEIHKYFEDFSSVINLYGSTETGFIAYKKESREDNFKLLKGIKIVSNDENKTIVTSEYSKQDEIILGDKLIYNKNNTIQIMGRTDRIFKIQEKRICAVEIEDELKKNKLVEDAFLVDLEDKIGAVIKLTEKGVNFLVEKGIYFLIRTLKLNLSEKFSIIPQKWKFLDEIPLNNMGKYDISKIKELFSVNLSLPFVLKRKIESNKAEFDLFFYKNCNFYKGHFEKFPITAGVIQLFYASYFIKEAFNTDCHTGQIKRIKFSNIIKPNSIVKLKLSKSEKYVDFEYLKDEKSYSSGALPIENIFEGKDYE